MDSTTLCGLWAAFAENPGDGEAAKAVKARLVDLLEHVDECDACRAVSERVPDSDQVFAVLSEMDVVLLSQDERELLDSGRRLVDEGTASIEAAVTDVLLPSLPDLVQPPQDVTPLQVFLATDAVNLLTRSVAADYPGQLLELSPAGLRAGDTLVSPRADLVGEIASHAGVCLDTADSLLAWQLLACEHCPGLYRGLMSARLLEGLLLAVQPSTRAEEMAARWAPMAVEEGQRLPPVIFDLFPATLAHALLEANDVLADQVPELQQVGQTLQLSGEKELGAFLVQQSEDSRWERQEFVRLLKSYRDGAAVHPDGVHGVHGGATERLSSSVTVTELGPVRTQEVVERARGRVLQRKVAYQAIFGFRVEGTINAEPLKVFAENGLRRADAQLRVLDNIKCC